MIDAILDALRGSSSSSGADRSAAAEERARLNVYRNMVRGGNSVSIEYLATAVGISFESALRDIQKMVAAGEFGKDAYINYVDKTLVLGTESQRSTGYASDASWEVFSDRSAAARNIKENVSRRREQERTRREAASVSGASVQQQKEEKTPKDKSKSTQTLLLIIGAVALFTGGVALIDTIDTLIWSGASTGVLSDIVMSLFFLGGGAAAIGSRMSLKRRANRFVTYSAAIGGREYISLDELKSTAGVKEKTLMRDLDVMLEKGMFGDSAYIDRGNRLLVLKREAVPVKEAEPETPEDDEDRYRAILREIRKVNDDIPDPEISAQIDEMEDLTAKIFKAVQEKPEKLPQIKSFMSYYLPTALKLLHSYADFDSAGAGGDNVQSAKADIERILDMLVEGFRKQLDKLYETEAMDISSDIDVLENMLRRDGLSGDGSGFGTVMGGH